MAKDTREKILNAAAQLIHRQGYNRTGLQEILATAGVPKGSFYFYFKSKEDLALALVNRFIEFWLGQAEELLSDPTRPALSRLRDFYAIRRAHFLETGFAVGCPVGNLSQEMGDLSPVLGERLDQVIDTMAGRLAQVLAEAQDRGELALHHDPQALAYFIVSSWQGALIRMKVCKCPEPLDIFLEMVFGRLLAA